MQKIIIIIVATCFWDFQFGLEASDNLNTAVSFEQSGAYGLARSGSEVRTSGSLMLPVSLPGSLSLDITLAFDNVTDLSLATTGISASVVDPLDHSILSRMPTGAISIPAEFPVLVLIEPPTVGLNTLAFDGIVELTLLTSDLPYYPDTRLRLFSAHDGADFADITREVSQGSYRVRGSGGTFSEFVIVMDSRETEVIVDTKLVSLLSLLSGYSNVIEPGVFANLQALLNAADSLWEKRLTADAVAELDHFTAAIIAASPADLPTTWDATGGPDNVAGILRAKADTLRFSLNSMMGTVRSQ